MAFVKTLVIVLLFFLNTVSTFTHRHCTTSGLRTEASFVPVSLALKAAAEEDIDLTSDGGVIILGDNILPCDTLGEVKAGSRLVISYRGTLAAADWSPAEVVGCWLNHQQGLGDLGEPFIRNGVSEATLIDPNLFTESFALDTLGLVNAPKIKLKKLIMAAKRLAVTRSEFNVGDEFDQNEKYEIEWDVKPKLIQGMRKALEYMVSVGLDRAIVKCRCDYAYGAEGYRKRTGEVLIPPFASLQFDICLVEAVMGGGTSPQMKEEDTLESR